MDIWKWVSNGHGTVTVRNNRVGIHNDNPSSNLDVNGGAKFSGGITASGGITVSGTTTTDVLSVTGGSDVAEPYHVTGVKNTLPIPGMVVSICPAKLGQMQVAARAYDRTVGGIISGANGVRPGIVLRQSGSVADGTFPVASVGRVWCWCDADANGPIKPGDLLTTSPTPGHAMRAGTYGRAKGAILGKAMSSLKRGKGLVFVLVTLQ